MNNPSAWAHLPNATHIDNILAHLKQHPERWNEAQDAAWDAAQDAARGTAWNAAQGAARDAAWNEARDAAWDAAQDAAWDAAQDAAWDAAWDAARHAILYLIAYDDCAYVLSLPVGAVRLMCSVGNQKAILLYPAVLAMERA